MRYRPPDNHDLPPEILKRKISTNAYVQEIYEFADTIVPHPTPEPVRALLAERFSPSSPLHVEIGCGSGRYVAELSRRLPDHNFVGMELRYKRLVLAAKKLELQNNVLLLKEKGEYLEDYFEPASIDAVHVNFPDPWAKKKQLKHRLLCPSFFELLKKLLKPGGAFFFKTDHREYFVTVSALLKELSYFELVDYTDDLHQSAYNEDNIETEFEGMFQHKANPRIGYLKVQLCG